MRITAYPLLLAGASLAIQQAGAVPLRVVVFSSHQEVSTNLRPEPAVAHVVPLHAEGHVYPIMEHTAAEPGVDISVPKPAHQCGFRKKVMQISSKIFGYPFFHHDDDAETDDRLAHIMPPPPEPGRVRILPFIGTPLGFENAATELKPAEESLEVQAPTSDAEITSNMRQGYNHMQTQDAPGPVRVVHMSAEEGPRMRFRHHRGPFLHRMHFALMALGPWEGRAVAFVLGCGIGVLLRMVWVLGVVMVRAFSSDRRSDEPSETMFEADAEEYVVPPPQYTDEKIALATPVDSKPTEN